MKYPARCNKRRCQARRNLSKHPDDYVKRPKCHVCNEGLMYLDSYRMNKGKKDHAPICRKDCLPYPHLVSSKECKHNPDYLAERNSKERSKHSPIPKEEWVPF